MRRSVRISVWLGALLALVAVFLAYLDPHVMVVLANQLWACF